MELFEFEYFACCDTTMYQGRINEADH